jgi:deazaflavin-dependent oxidoreductase (nitroreductase family)
MGLDRTILAAHRTIDLITEGRHSGLPRRVEIWWFHVEGRFIVSGTPGQRDWLANINANSSVVIHVNGEEIPACAVAVEDREFRRRFFTRPSTSWYSTQSQLEHLVETAPMVEILFED